MFEDTRIKKRIDVGEFTKFLCEYNKEQIKCTEHTFFRLSEKQRKIYSCDELKRILIYEKPFLVGFQYNQKYSVFYKYNNKNLKIVIDIAGRKIKIVTFYFIEEWQIPKI